MTIPVPAPAPADAAEALAMLDASLDYLAHAAPADMPAVTREDCLRGLERATTRTTAARSAILGTFWDHHDYVADGDMGPRPWLVRETRIPWRAGGWHLGWVRRLERRPRMAAMMADGILPESVAKLIDKWLRLLPEDQQDKAEKILLKFWAKGVDIKGLAEMFGEIRAKLALPDENEPAFKDRYVLLEKTMDGAGYLKGSLTPECATMLGTMLDALGAPAGPDDHRSEPERYHDALHEAASRFIASGTLPQRGGQPVKAWVHISLADLLLLDGSAQITAEWIARAHATWAAARAGAATRDGGMRGDGGAWLTGTAAAAMACDASLTPVVTGDIDPGVIEDLIKLCHQLAADPTDRGRDSLEQAIIARAVALVSGPTGLASYLRRSTLGAPLGGPSLPLDVGYSENIPIGIRNAVKLRDQHCRWSGGCNRPASHCHVHHTTRKADGGPTSVTDCVLLCPFHHLIAIHEWGWTLTLNPDGTTTAVNAEGTKILHSHGPPARPG